MRTRCGAGRTIPGVSSSIFGWFRGAYAISIALATVCSSSQSVFTATNTFRYHSSNSSIPVLIASFTASVILSALFITTSHILTMLSLHARSFSSDTTSSCPSIVSRHLLEAAAISSSDHTSALAWKLWYSLNAVIRRKEACVGNGEECIVQSLC